MTNDASEQQIWHPTLADVKEAAALDARAEQN
jgi:hypothetical protein